METEWIEASPSKETHEHDDSIYTSDRAVYSFNSYYLAIISRWKILLIILAILVVELLVFKTLYPLAGFISGDSYIYLESASRNLTVNTYPIGYSKFVRLFSVFSKSDLLLVSFQFFFIHFSCLFLCTSIFYFVKVRKITVYIVLGFLLLNPLYFYLANYISSDAIFFGLSCLWFTILLWLRNAPNWNLIVLHAVLLLLCFTVRHNALIYPVVAVVAILLLRTSPTRKVVGCILSTGFCLLFVLFTSKIHKDVVGSWQYSPFSGWQMANNAMYAYRYVEKRNRVQVPIKYRILDSIVTTYFDKSRANLEMYPHEYLEASTVYMWTPGLPLHQYMDSMARRDNVTDRFIKWARMGPLYYGYGIWLMRQYPREFLRHFLWPNASKYFAPPVEFLRRYNMGRDSIRRIAMEWFDFKSSKVYTRTRTFDVNILDYYPYLSGILNGVYAFCVLVYLTGLGGRFDNSFTKYFCMWSVLWSMNAAFTIFASSAALRFQVFPIIGTFIFLVVFVDQLFGRQIEEH